MWVGGLGYGDVVCMQIIKSEVKSRVKKDVTNTHTCTNTCVLWCVLGHAVVIEMRRCYRAF